MVTSIVLWALIIICFALAFIALIKPIIPGVPVLWVGFLIYYFGINKSNLNLSFWIIMVIFTAVIFLADFLANAYFLKKYGSTKTGERVGCLAVIVGSFVFPPFGLIIVPFISVFVAEKLQGKDTKESIKSAWATVLSFISSSLAKAILQVIMVIIFFVYLVF
ncbi:DUF456 domain-containing protein [Bacillus sp. AFS017336]|uniref:DUF456 domain-containing protein n=1 Tax=Bacillaceae TaxID=186817 RepID=UPI000BF19868|nr:DUF456 family protein [Bacillus sp. AFS017336]PEL11274.1 hypothetical protein CN601_11020 [Bacillus sp. AFS017336]QKE71566.1 DUF456 domain-containing protein [Arthrobacter citreus]